MHPGQVDRFFFEILLEVSFMILHKFWGRCKWRFGGIKLKELTMKDQNTHPVGFRKRV